MRYLKSEAALIVYCGLLLVLFFGYDYHNILAKRPQGVHQWRQTDCLSITHHYYTNEASFLSPKIHNQSSVDGRAISEFPIIYYLNAQLWKVFGKREWIARAVNLIITYLGLFCLFRIFQRITKSDVLSILLGILCFTSPIYAYYGNNFLSNVPALSFAIISSYFFMKYIDQRKLKFLVLYFTFFAFAGLLKATSLFIFCIISFVVLFEFFIKSGKLLFLGDDTKKYLLGMLLVIVAILSWYSYAYNYNMVHNSGAFLVGILPIWELNLKEITIVLEEFQKFWLNDIMRLEVMLIPLTGIIGMTIYSFKKQNRSLTAIIIVMLLGLIGYIAFWFQVYNEHDYYLIDAYVVIISGVIGFAYLLSLWLKNQKTRSYVVYTLLLAVLVHSAIHTQYRVRKRYRSWMNRHHEAHFKAFENIEPTLRSAGILVNDFVISIPDGAINTSLYLMNQKGWTNYGNELNNMQQVREKINQGAKYLVVNDQSFIENSFWESFTKNEFLSYKNIKIYKLD